MTDDEIARLIEAEEARPAIIGAKMKELASLVSQH